MERREASELDHPDSAWNRAAASTEQADPFCCRTEWQLAFHETFAPQRPLVLRQRGPDLLAFAEVAVPSLGVLLEPVESNWLFGTPLLGRGAIDLLGELLAERAAAGEPPNVVLSGILARDARRKPLLATLQRHGTVRLAHRETLCTASLDGGLDGWLSRRTGRFRRALRAAERRAADRGVRFERHVPRTAAEADAVYDRMLAVERRSWKGIGRCGMAEPPSREFYRAMLRRLAVSGAGRVAFARCGEADIGFVFGGMAGDVYRGQQFSFADDWSAASIGNLLQFEQLRWLGEERGARYDMGPAMDYKRHWTEGCTVVEAWRLQPR